MYHTSMHENCNGRFILSNKFQIQNFQSEFFSRFCIMKSKLSRKGSKVAARHNFAVLGIEGEKEFTIENENKLIYLTG